MKKIKNTYSFTDKEWQICLKVLEELKDNPLENPDNQRFGALVTKIYKSAKKQLKGNTIQENRLQDLEIIKKATIANNALQNKTLYSPLKNNEITFEELNRPRNCYACNQSYHKANSFYHKLCPTCAELNYQYRFVQPDLSNRNVIVTGGRVKVGFATALKFLRSKANVIVTTRFPALALVEFQKQTDYKEWKERLEIYGLDLRNLKAIENFIHFYQSKNETLDILVNNAAQTIKYTEDYYRPLIQKENQLLLTFFKEEKILANDTPIISEIKLLENKSELGEIARNRFGQPIDSRMKNSWNSTLEEIDTYELLEVNLINNIAPYLLVKGLLSNLIKSSFAEKFIINVTSSEGQFSYSNKTIFHPHTNMTKAALNMMTRTAAEDYAKKGIYMNSVDVGWISTGAQEELRKRQFEKGYIPPLDSVDGAARIFHPIVEAIENKIIFVGKLLKNYQSIDW